MNGILHSELFRYCLALIALNFVLLAATSAQTPQVGSGDWTRIESASKDFSIALPSGDYLVNREKTKVWIWYADKRRSISISMEKNGGAKTRLKALIASSRDPRFQKAEDPEYQTIELDDFLGRWYTKTSDKDGSESYSFELASSKGSYYLSVRAPKGDSEFAQRFLRTARLGDKPLIKSDTSDVRESRTVSVETLQTSDIVLQALKQPPADLKFNKDLVIDSSPGDAKNVVYSRDLIIVSKARPEYTDEARSQLIEGTVALMIKFLANGTIGSIRVVKSLGGGLDRTTFNAARQIKFIPAEIDGKPVDMTFKVEYSFTIY